MNIIYKAAFLIDRESNKAEFKEIIEGKKGFGNYIQQLVNKIDTNPKTRAFKVISQSAEVISQILKIANKAISGEMDLETHCQTIADKFLRCEIQAQKNNRMVEMQKGSLIIVVFESEENYRVLLAKIAHDIFVVEEDYSTKNGFKIDDVSHWKTCSFDFIQNDDLWEIDAISVFLNHSAVYWYESFIEIAAINSDENNTKTVFDEVLKEINTLTKGFPGDRFDFKNSLIGYMKQDRLFNYIDLVDHLIDNHDNSEIGKDRMQKIKERLLTLPDKKEFDRQFRTVPTMIKSRVRTTKFNVNANIELVIKDHINNKNDITAHEESGKKYLLIRTNDDRTYNTFKVRETGNDSN